MAPADTSPAAGTCALLLVHLWWRVEGLGRARRRPLVWLVIGLATVTAVAFVVAFATPTLAGAEGVVIALAGLPAVCMVIGVHRPDLVDATAIVVEAGVLAVVAVTGLALYVTAASLLTLAGSPPPVGLQAVLAVAVAAVLPRVRSLVHGSISVLLIGRPPDPVAAVAQAVEGSTDDTEALLARIREALALPFAAVRDRAHGTDLAVSGPPPAHARSFPLLPTRPDDRDEVLDEVLVVGLRPGELHLGRTDLEVLTLVARLLGQIRRAERLTAQLSESRSAIRSAVEEERRRLRRELHDGLGPTLSGIAFTADAALNLTRPEAVRVRDLLERLRREATVAVDDVRRLAYDMRPPALDQIGLRGALERVAATHSGPARQVLVVVDDLGELPAAVEVAAYRVAVEGMTNAVRHGRPSRVAVAVTRGPAAVDVAVTDDGGAAAGPVAPGVGLTSMRERAEELGGTLRTGPAGDGWRVDAHLPLDLPRTAS